MSPLPGNPHAMTDPRGGYKVLVVLTYLGIAWKASLYPELPQGSAEAAVGFASQLNLSLPNLLLFLPLSHS